MKSLFTRFTLAAALLLSLAQSLRADIFTDMDGFFQKNVDANGLLDYKAIQAQPGDLNNLMTQIGAFNVGAVRGNSLKAFWINAYNLVVIKNIVNQYPIAKPTDDPGFFNQKKFMVAGQMRTLDQIENQVIRPTFQDARLHFVLVCGAKSCPPLLNRAYMPTTLETQIDAQVRKAMNSATFTRVNNATMKVELSQIFDWYRADFLAVKPTLVAYVNQYRTTAIPANYTQSFYTYDWSVNAK